MSTNISKSQSPHDDIRSVESLSAAPVGKLLWHYSLPAVVGMLVMSLYNVIDRIFIGQGVGPEAIAGLAITFPVMNISSALGVLIGAGSCARISIMLGAKNPEEARIILGNALVLILINATIYLSLFTYFLDDLLRLFGASDVTLPYAHDFMLYIMPGMLAMNIGFTLNSIMRASGYPIKAMVTLFVGAGINLILAPIFIFVLNWGIKGAAIATDISMGIFAVIVAMHFLNPKNTVHFAPGTFRLRTHVIWAIVSIGISPALINFASCFINVIINNSLYCYGGDAAVAAAGVFVTVTSLMVMVVVGICQGMQPVIGYNYGAGRIDRLMRTYWLATAWGTAVVTIGCMAGMFAPNYIARAFTTDPTLIAVTSDALPTAMPLFWCVGIQVVSTTFFQAIGKVVQSILLSLSRQVIFIIPLLLWFSNRYGLYGVWLSFPVSDGLATLVTVILIAKQIHAFKHAKERPTTLHFTR